MLTPLSNEHIENIGGYAGLFVSPNQIKSIQSSDSSINVTNNADNIDLTVAAGNVIQGTSSVYWDPSTGQLDVRQVSSDRTNPYKVILRTASSDLYNTMDVNGNMLYDVAGGFIVCIGLNSQAQSTSQTTVRPDASYDQGVYAQDYLNSCFFGQGTAYNVDAPLSNVVVVGPAALHTDTSGTAKSNITAVGVGALRLGFTA